MSEGKFFQINGMTFKYSKYDSMEGHVICEWKQETEKPNPFSIKTSKNGMWFEGKMDGDIFGENEIQKFAELISLAWQDHRSLKIRIIRSLSGH